MSVRDTYLKEYGFTFQEIKNMENYCRHASQYEQDLLLKCAREVYPEIASQIFFSLTTGFGYDRMGNVQMQRKDFQGYRRKTLETYYRHMWLELGKDISRGN